MDHLNGDGSTALHAAAHRWLQLAELLQPEKLLKGCCCCCCCCFFFFFSRVFLDSGGLIINNSYFVLCSLYMHIICIYIYMHICASFV